MSVDLGTKTITGDAEERTWRITIETPATGHADPLTGYKIIVHREEAIFDGSGVPLDTMPGERYEFTAGQALAKDATILTDIVTVIEALIVDANA